ncbi:MAG: GrrA/OscA1 family cyclophane-containing rSAM-modified RiPP [Snowella sp.]|nr:GrrA/OscA1 family cyclophane-containing rSAM-modified RiPP [Snowella sp.]
MNLSTKMGWAAFLVALSAFQLPPAEAKNYDLQASQNATQETSPANVNRSQTGSVQDRLNRISSTLKAKASQLPGTESQIPSDAIALGWGNLRGGGSFVNLNRPAWRNGWGDGGGFLNRSWPNGGWGNGGGWRNGGGFFNRY